HQESKDYPRVRKPVSRSAEQHLHVHALKIYGSTVSVERRADAIWSSAYCKTISHGLQAQFSSCSHDCPPALQWPRGPAIDGDAAAAKVRGGRGALVARCDFIGSPMNIVNPPLTVISIHCKMVGGASPEWVGLR
ncbi:hypothetical protein MUK42_14397, partial [Musa troglodytarum]